LNVFGELRERGALPFLDKKKVAADAAPKVTTKVATNVAPKASANVAPANPAPVNKDSKPKESES
jgi:hypothetical protein